MATYTAIKRDTTFPITVGGNTLINLQKLLLYVLADKTEEEIQAAYESIIKQEYPEDWYEHYAFLAIMIKQIEQTAVDQGLAVQEELSDATQPGDSLPAQSL